MLETSDITLETTLGRSESLLYSEVDGDVTIMSVETGKYYSLTSSAARIWTLFEQPTSAARVCDRLITEYRVEHDRCERDVLQLLRKMADEGVLNVLEGRD